eukprot:7919214-Alexandrium_andersonii.AAC.1
MSASLVGSEMCIRDRSCSCSVGARPLTARPQLALGGRRQAATRRREEAGPGRRATRLALRRTAATRSPSC